jgi:hypothetical protein
MTPNLAGPVALSAISDSSRVENVVPGFRAQGALNPGYGAVMTAVRS